MTPDPAGQARSHITSPRRMSEARLLMAKQSNGTGMTRNAASLYRGSLKHKSRPSRGRKGTICPEWTHRGSDGLLGNDPHAHDWRGTLAAELFEAASIDPGSQRRFATRNGVAFEAKPTADGTWHGFPLPWEDVPAALKDKWLDEGLVRAQDVRRFFSRPRKDVRWALDTDDE